MKRNFGIIAITFILICGLSDAAYSDCRGCCSNHGGVVCIDGITMCGDGSPLSSTCRANGCNKCDSYVPPPPSALDPLTLNANTSTIIGAIPLSVNFSANATGGEPPYDYHWNFGDGQSSFLEDPIHIYLSPGNYEATVTVTDAKNNLKVKTLNISARDANSTNEKIKIASFNIQVFGISKASNETVMNRLAEIISFFDIVSIQEIRDISETAIEDLEVKIDSLGIDYEYILGPRLGRTSSKEQYAYMYRKDTVDVESFYTLEDSADVFHREPLIAKFKAKNGNFDFVLITIHVDPDEATEEISHLPSAIVDAQNHFPSELDFIILGDLNADCSYFDEDDDTIGLKNPRFTWLIDNTMDTNLASSQCTYDRIIIIDETKEDYAGAADVFLFDEYFGLSYEEALDISDHYPVWGEFYINNDTDSQQVVSVLSKTSPDYTITGGSFEQIYGTASPNQIILESGAKGELYNFPGQNTIEIQSSSDLFTVSRSGTFVTFEGSDGTVLKIPATFTGQIISFNDEQSRVLQIHNNQVILDDQVITLTPTPIENNQVTEALIKSSVLYDAAPVYSSVDQAALVSGFSEFGFDFYQALRAETSTVGKNFFFSPYSLENALAMTWAGAENQTADQMADVLHFNLSQDFLHSTLNGLNIDINSRDDKPPPSGDPFALNSVNAVWSRIGYPFVQDYLDVIAANYDAGIRTLDFMGNPDGSRQTINQWVGDQTNEKIKDLLPPGSISPVTAVVLTNAIYFKASWYEKFDAARTAPGPFTLLDGTTVTAEMMHRETDTRYYRDSSFDVVELPYASPEFLEYEYPQELAMLVIIPHNGVFESVESSLDKSSLDAIVDSLSMGTVNLTFPKFEFESETKCGDILRGLGMTDALDPFSADFSGMVSPLYSEPWIDEIYHKAFVAVDENGTEAAAATAVVMADASIPEIIDISADKPFIFLIYDHFTQTILFMGRVLDPTYSG